MKTLFIAAACLVTLAALAPVRAAGATIDVVTAENFYGDVARQIGGDRVSVSSILNNPDQDPHLFEPTPSTVRQIAAAQIVVFNGAGYDPWVDKLLNVTPTPRRAVISAAVLVHAKAGADPHLWYDPRTIPAVAGALADALGVIDAAHKDEYDARLKAFLISLEPLDQKVAAIGKRYAGTDIAATEPVFDYMAAALKLKMHDAPFQLAVMNDTEPSASELAAFERELKTRQIRVLFYNKQASNDLVSHLLNLARASHIPVVGVSETAPSGQSYQDWMLSELDATATALAGSAP